jgi:Flp pilus assembly protein TadD
MTGLNVRLNVSDGFSLCWELLMNPRLRLCLSGLILAAAMNGCSTSTLHLPAPIAAIMPGADVRFHKECATARLLEQRSELVIAEQTYQSLAQRYPSRYEVYQRLGVVAQKRGNTDIAIRNFKRAHELAPLNAEVLGDLGYSEYLAGNYAKAIETLRQAQELNPNHPRIQANLAMAMVAAGDVNSAHQIFRQTSSDSEARTNLGFALIQHGKIDQGRHAFEKAIQMDPNQTKAAEALVQLAGIPIGESKPNAGLQSGRALDGLGIAVREGSGASDSFGVAVLGKSRVDGVTGVSKLLDQQRIDGDNTTQVASNEASKIAVTAGFQSVSANSSGGSGESNSPGFVMAESRSDVIATVGISQSELPAYVDLKTRGSGIRNLSPETSIQDFATEFQRRPVQADEDPRRVNSKQDSAEQSPLESAIAVRQRPQNQNDHGRVQSGNLNEDTRRPDHRVSIAQSRVREEQHRELPSLESAAEPGRKKREPNDRTRVERLLATSRGARNIPIPAASGRPARLPITQDEAPTDIVAAPKVLEQVEAQAETSLKTDASDERPVPENEPARLSSENDDRWQLALRLLASRQKGQSVAGLRVITELIKTQSASERIFAWQCIQDVGKEAQVAGPKLLELASETTGLEAVESAFAIYRVFGWTEYAELRLYASLSDPDPEVRTRAAALLRRCQ